MDDAVVVSHVEQREWPGPSWRERAVRIASGLAIITVYAVVPDLLHVTLNEWLGALMTVALVGFVSVVVGPALKKHTPYEVGPGVWSVALTDVGPKPIQVLKVLRDYGAPFMTAQELAIEVTGSRGGMVVVRGVAELEATLLERRLRDLGATAAGASDEEAHA